ncbi:MAG: hypothetical protein HKN92_04695 [Chitinophagales bacterium]|nr:hypothetical protein [Chitinophagales bacterium]
MGIRLIIIISCVLSILTATGQDYRYKSTSLQIGEDKLEVYYGADKIYMTVDQMQQFDEDNNFQKLAVMAYYNGKPFNRNKITKVNGKVKKIRYFSSDTTILKFKKATSFLNQGFFNVKTVGSVDIIAVFDNKDSIIIPLTVQALDIEAIFDEAAIIDFIGEPTKKNIQRVPYNTIEVIDGIVYNTEDLIKGMVVKHWLYDDYPGAVLIIDPIESQNHVLVVQPAWLNVANRLFDNL